MKLKRISSPSEAVSLAEAKGHFRILHSDEDVDIARVIEASTEKAEQITNRQLAVATYEGYLDVFVPCLALPKPPFKSVAKVEYIDVEGNTKAWSDFYVDDVAEPSMLYFDAFPSDVKTTGVNNVIVTFDCGYDAVPAAIKSWILIHGLTLFENRENMVIGTIVSLEPEAYYNHLLDSYRIIPV